MLESTNLRLRGTSGRRGDGMPARACPTPPAWMGSASPWRMFSAIRSVCAHRAWPATSKALAPACRALLPSLLSVGLHRVTIAIQRRLWAGNAVAARRCTYAAAAPCDGAYHGVRQPRACRRRRPERHRVRTRSHRTRTAGEVLGVCEGSWGAPGGSAIVAARRVIEPADNPGGKGDDPGRGSSLSWISAHPFIKREVCNLDLTIHVSSAR